MSGNHNNYQKKQYYPKKYKGKKSYPVKHQNPPNIFGGFFNGNLANSMKFGGEDHELSGYVKREVYIRDKYGNVQRANEAQFFNSSKSPMIIRTGHDKNNGRF